jgi:tetratricopeptide (TPR) repeat protein
VTAAILTAVVVPFGRPLASAWYANLGAVHQTWADLAPDLDEAGREAEIARAVAYFQQALRLNPSQPAANRRLGMIALDHREFDVAVAYLERAYPQERENQATLKALGLAYLWTGRLDPAEELLRQLDVQSEMVEELNAWTWWWHTQDRDDLSAYAAEMAQRLSQR